MSSVGQRSFGELGTPLAEVPFCVLDLETTGVAPDTCEITEIGAAQFVAGVEVARFQTLVNPGLEIPPSVTVITGITHAMVIDAPRIEEALPSFLEFLGDSVIVGHNVRFDISFLNAAAIRLGYGRLPHQHADTLRLAQRLVRNELRSMKLSSLSAFFGSPVVPNHRALDDALATAHVFWSLLERAGSIGVTHLDDLLALPTIKGSRAIGKLSLTERLPRSPGVYTFVDRNGVPIYIGKATNLRSRVRSYFGGDPRKRVDNLLRDLVEIRYHRTCGEIEAGILELRAIYDEQPRYNRRSKRPRTVHWLRLTSEQFPRLSITRTPGNTDLALGPFRTRRAAESVMFALWDTSKIRRCTTKGRGCGFSQLGGSICPCDGDISTTTYSSVVRDLIDGIERPASLKRSIDERIGALAEHQMYEDAAAVRDRWLSLARAIERSRAWRSLQDAGRVTASGQDGVTLTIDHGSMIAAWRTGETSPLIAPHDDGAFRQPPDVLALDEAMLLWNWLSAPGVEILGVSGTLAVPSTPVPVLVGAHPDSQRVPQPLPA
ncbi:MAG: DEDD exonuclease domain-containing protein [Actinomycetia bacterium]|nr:DEDD exonuclease domain-containing protein [Actinomycetes bacterium]